MHRGEDQSAHLRFEESRNPPRQFTVGILTVVFFVVKSSKETHKFYSHSSHCRVSERSFAHEAISIIEDEIASSQRLRRSSQ